MSHHLKNSVHATVSSASPCYLWLSLSVSPPFEVEASKLRGGYRLFSSQ